jgi:hypothetical protein
MARPYCSLNICLESYSVHIQLNRGFNVSIKGYNAQRWLSGSFFCGNCSYKWEMSNFLAEFSKDTLVLFIDPECTIYHKTTMQEEWSTVAHVMMHYHLQS